MEAEIVARIQIRDVIERYFHALDMCDGALLATCFAEDADVRYHVGTPGEFGQTGGEEVTAYLVRNMGSYHVRTHSIANVGISLSRPDRASSVTNAMAILWKRDRIHFRGLRYSDDLALRDGAWRIVKRRHQPLWQFNSDPTVPEVPAPAMDMARRAGAQHGGAGAA